ncbi:MAG: L,D-transpeptidase family protein [Ilumatobacteraceae bacterium]
MIGTPRRLAGAAAALVLVGVLASCSEQVAAPPSPETQPGTTQVESTTPATRRPRQSTAVATTPPTEKATTTTQKPTNTTWPSPVVAIGAARSPIAAVGQSSGSSTAVLQQRLLDLGFWLQGANGSYDLTTAQAVMAFQKYKGLSTTGSVDSATAAALTSQPERARGRADAGTLVEIDKSRQVLFVIRDGKVVWAFNTSTANGEAYTEPDQNSPGEKITDVAVTPDGLWQVERERQKGWWKGDLGQIYRPKYFVGGVAVHGSNSIPNYPASHGCVRVSVPAMDFIWGSDLVPLTTPVWVHGEWGG